MSSSVIGNIVDSTGAARTATLLTFSPLSLPQVDGPDLITSTDTTCVTSATDGSFTVELCAGDYKLVIDRDTFCLSVPTEDGEYQLDDLLTDGTLVFTGGPPPSGSPTATTTVYGMVQLAKTDSSPKVYTQSWLDQIFTGLGTAALYAGQTSIAILGIVTTGTWNATPIANAYLANSSITVTAGHGLGGGGSVSLGGSTTVNLFCNGSSTYTANAIPKFDSTSTLGYSSLTDTSTRLTCTNGLLINGKVGSGNTFRDDATIECQAVQCQISVLDTYVGGGGVPVANAGDAGIVFGAFDTDLNKVKLGSLSYTLADVGPTTYYAVARVNVSDHTGDHVAANYYCNRGAILFPTSGTEAAPGASIYRIHGSISLDDAQAVAWNGATALFYTNGGEFQVGNTSTAGNYTRLYSKYGAVLDARADGDVKIYVDLLMQSGQAIYFGGNTVFASVTGGETQCGSAVASGNYTRLYSYFGPVLDAKANGDTQIYANLLMPSTTAIYFGGNSVFSSTTGGETQVGSASTSGNYTRLYSKFGPVLDALADGDVKIYANLAMPDASGIYFNGVGAFAYTDGARTSVGNTTTGNYVSLYVGGGEGLRVSTGGVVTLATWHGVAIANAYLANSSITITPGSNLSGGGGVSLGGSVTISFNSSYAGATSIVTLGTVTTGVWNGAAITNSYLANSAVTITTSTGLSGGGSVSLGGSLTLTVNQAFSPTWTGTHVFSGHDVTIHSGDLLLDDSQAIRFSGVGGFYYADGGQTSVGNTTSGNYVSLYVGGGEGLRVSTGGIVTLATWHGVAIANAYLANSALTVTAGAGLATGGSVSLGGSVTLTTDETYAHTWTALHTYSLSTDSTSFASGAQAIKLTTTASATDNTHHKASPWLSLTASIWTGSATAKLFQVQNQGVSGTSSAYQLVLQSTDTSSILLIRGDTGNITTSANLAVGGTLTAGTYVGQTSIVTLGTITTGVWNGTAIANANLANSSVTVTTSTGLSGGGSLSLGGSLTLTVDQSFSPTWTGTHLFSGHVVTIKDDLADYTGDTGQLTIEGSSNTNKRLTLGYATTGDYGFIRAVLSGTTEKNLILNPSGDGHVIIGGTSDLGSGNLQIYGGITFSGARSIVTTSGTLTLNGSGNVALGTVTSGVWNGTAISNSYLANSSLTVTAGTGLSGGGSVSLGGSVTISVSTSYAGGSSIATVGTITTGVWHGTLIGLLYGGTGADLSGTGGAGKYLKQASSGAAITVATITAPEVTQAVVCLFSQSAAVAISNSVATSVCSGIGSVGSNAIAANSLKVGSQLRFRASGSAGMGAAAAYLGFNFLLAGSTYSISFSATGGAQYFWTVDFVATMTAIGASAAYNYTFELRGVTGGVTTSANASGVGSATFDSTAATNWDCQGELTYGGGSPSLTCRAATLEQLAGA